MRQWIKDHLRAGDLDRVVFELFEDEILNGPPSKGDDSWLDGEKPNTRMRPFRKRGKMEMTPARLAARVKGGKARQGINDQKNRAALFGASVNLMDDHQRAQKFFGYTRDFTAEEIASDTGFSTSTVYRARRRLREKQRMDDEIKLATTKLLSN